MKIKSITPVGKKPVYDISVAGPEHYILDNGVASHNTGSYYSADNIFILGRQQEKEGAELVGWNFIINVEKSRYVKEKSKIPVTLKNGTLSKWSGLMEMALDAKCVMKPSNGWYSRVDVDGVVEDKKWRMTDTDCKEFWLPVLSSKVFQDWVRDTYQVAAGSILSTEDSIQEELDNIPNE